MMKIFISEEGSGFEGTMNEFNQVVVDELLNMSPPKTKRSNTEYVANIANGSICIFRVDVGIRPNFIEGSMLAQINKGVLKIGFLDVNSENLVTNICNMIQDFWSNIEMEANGECAVMYSPLEGSSEF